MRAKFITTTIDNGARLEDVQRAGGHADLSTTKLYDNAASQYSTSGAGILIN